MRAKYRIVRNYTELGSYLQASRERRGLTQRQVSTKLGYSSPQFISNFERGISAPPIKKLKQLTSLYVLRPFKVIDLILTAERKILREALQ